MRVSDLPLPVLSKDLGVSQQTLRNWRRQCEVDLGQRDGVSSDQLEELRRLRRENRMLQMGREVLRKAGLLRLGERGALSEMFSFIAAEKANCRASLLCRVLGVRRTAFTRGSGARRLTGRCMTRG